MSTVEFAHLRTSNAAEFERCIKGALDGLATDRNCLAAKAYRCVEDPKAFILQITWKSIDAHEKFRAGPGPTLYRAQVQHLVVSAPEYAHYELIAAAGDVESP